MCLFLEAPVAFISGDGGARPPINELSSHMYRMSFADQIWMEITGQNISS